MEGQQGFPRQYGPSRSDHQPRIPFFPQETARDFVLIFLITALLLFLSAFVTPFFGPARSTQISELSVPDWYLLFSWGLLKVADVFPQFVIGAGTPLKTDFFFQAEDGIRGTSVTGVQTCALPIFDRDQKQLLLSFMKVAAIATIADSVPLVGENRVIASLGLNALRTAVNPELKALLEVSQRSEERR